MQKEEFLTVAEVAAELRLHTVTVQKLCRDGKLPSFRVGRVYRIPKRGFEDFRRGLAVEERTEADPRALEPELSALVTAWLKDMENGARPYSPLTIQTHRQHLYKYVRLLLGDDPGARIGYRDALNERALLRALAQIPVAKHASRYNLFMAVMAFSRFLAREGLLEEDVRTLMKRHKPRRLAPARRTVLNSTDELNRLIETVWMSEGHNNYEKTLNAAVIGTMAFAGLRVSEVANLEVGHVDPVNRVLYVVNGKGGKNRMVGVNPRLKAMIEAYLAVRPRSTSSVLFLTAKGTPLNRDYLNKRVRRIAKRAGLNVSAHGLRRTFATLNANAGKSLNLIQLALGHASLATTQTYLMADHRMAAKAMQEW